MQSILNLQKLQAVSHEEEPANSNGSSTCVGVSCTSNGCVPETKT